MSTTQVTRPSAIDLSIIIVNWNTRELLTECLRSIPHREPSAQEGGLRTCSIPQGRTEEADKLRSSPRGFTSSYLETFVIDNASADGSAESVREQFPWVGLIENRENVGFAAANNQGIRAAKGRYVLLLNSDTVIPPGSLDALIEFADAHPRAGVVGVRLVNPDGTFQAGPSRFPTLSSVVLESWGIIQRLSRNPYYPSHPPEHSDKALRCDWVGGACLLARRTAIEQVGVLDEHFFMNSEDVDWCYRMRMGGWEVWYTPAATIVHLGGASANRSTATQRQRTYRGKVLFLAKHHGPLSGRLAQAHFRTTSLGKSLAYAAMFLLCRDLRYRDAAASHLAVAHGGDWPRKS